MDRPCVWNLALIQFLDKNSEKNYLWAPQDVLFGMACQFHSHFFKVLPNLRLLGVVLLSLTNDLQMSIINSLSLINQNREILPKKNWNYFGKVLKCRTPSGRAFLTLYNPSHKIRRCQGTYCVHFSLFYTNVQFCTLFVNFWSCTLMYIGFHQEKKYKGYSFKTSQVSTIALLLEFQTFKSSEVKIGGCSIKKKVDLLLWPLLLEFSNIQIKFPP